MKAEITITVPTAPGVQQAFKLSFDKSVFSTVIDKVVDITKPEEVYTIAATGLWVVV